MQIVEQTAELAGVWAQAAERRRSLADDVRNTLLLLLAAFTIYPEIKADVWLERAFLALVVIISVWLLAWSRPWAKFWSASRADRREAKQGLGELARAPSTDSHEAR